MLDNVRVDVQRYLGLARQEEGLPLGTMLFTFCFSFGLHATIVYRFGRWIARTFAPVPFWPIRFPLFLCYRVLEVVVRVAYGIRIDPQADIGRGLYVGHFGRIQVGACRMGEFCSIHQQVHIDGGAADSNDSRTYLGDYVWVGPHARLSAGIQVGDRATIAAGAFVRSNVKNRCLVAGNPARLAILEYDNESLLFGRARKGNTQAPPSPERSGATEQVR